ncbi:MAG: radical SAM protein [Candidatus Omnitrophota bacterium]
MKIILLRLPIAYGGSSLSRAASPGGYLSTKLYCEWLVRYPPLGLLYYGSLLKQKGHTVILLDGELMGYSVKNILSLTKKFSPDIICATVNIYNPQSEFEALKILKNNTKSTLIARGHFPRLYPEETIANEHIDIALTGKGFNSICQTIEAIDQKQQLETVKGIIYRKENNTIVKTPEEEPFNFDNIPFPAREIIDNSFYTTALTKYNKFTTLTTSIGCPFSCTYCVDRHIPYQARSIENVITEIEQCINDFGIKEITFLDSTFSLDRKRSMQLCKEIINRNLKFKWAIRTRPDLVDDELLTAFVSAGCISIHYGIESGDQKILNNVNRKMKLEQIKRAVELTVRKGMETLGFFMIGNDGESIDSVKNTINFARSLPLHFAQFNIAFPIPSSRIFEVTTQKLKMDIWIESYKGKNISREMCKPQNTNLSAEQLTYWANKAYRSFYFQPKQLWRLLTFKYAPHIIIRQFKILLIHFRQLYNRLINI